MPYANNHGINVHYEIEGKGCPLVVMHGFAGSSQDWHDAGFVEGLSADYLLILIDERGHGLSDKPHDPRSYAMEKRVDDVIVVLNKLEILKAHFMGYSMGGEVCFGIAKYAPERTRSLIIGGMHPYAPQYPEVYNQQIQILTKGIPAAADAWGQKSPKERGRFLKNDAQALIASTIAARDWSGCADILPAMKMPCLLYAGESDELMYSSIKECVKHIPNSVFISLPDLSHGDAYVRSDLVLPHIKRFLSEMR